MFSRFNLFLGLSFLYLTFPVAESGCCALEKRSNQCIYNESTYIHKSEKNCIEHNVSDGVTLWNKYLHEINPPKEFTSVGIAYIINFVRTTIYSIIQFGIVSGISICFTYVITYCCCRRNRDPANSCFILLSGCFTLFVFLIVVLEFPLILRHSLGDELCGRRECSHLALCYSCNTGNTSICTSCSEGAYHVGFVEEPEIQPQNETSWPKLFHFPPKVAELMKKLEEKNFTGVACEMCPSGKTSKVWENYGRQSCYKATKEEKKRKYYFEARSRSHMFLYHAKMGNLYEMKQVKHDNPSVDINTVDKNGDTALIIASRENHLEMIEYLVGKGAKLGIQNEKGESALTILNVAEKEHGERTRNPNPKSTNEFSKKKLFTQHILMEKLRKAQIKEEKYAKTQLTIMGIIFADKNVKQEQRIILTRPHLQNGITEIGYVNSSFLYLLGNVQKTFFFAAKNDYANYIRHLLHITHTVIANETPVSSVSTLNSDELKYIRKSSINIDAVDNKGMTALMYAALKGHARVVRVLMDAEANLTLTTPSNMSAINFAGIQGHHAIVRILHYNEKLWYARYVVGPTVSVLILAATIYVSIPLCRKNTGIAYSWTLVIPVTTVVVGLFLMQIGDMDGDGDVDKSDAFLIVDENEDDTLDFKEVGSATFIFSGSVSIFIFCQIILLAVYAKYFKIQDKRNKLFKEKVEKDANKVKMEAKREAEIAKENAIIAKKKADVYKKEADSAANRKVNAAKAHAQEKIAEAQGKVHVAREKAKNEVARAREEVIAAHNESHLVKAAAEHTVAVELEAKKLLVNEISIAQNWPQKKVEEALELERRKVLGRRTCSSCFVDLEETNNNSNGETKEEKIDPVVKIAITFLKNDVGDEKKRCRCSKYMHKEHGLTKMEGYKVANAALKIINRDKNKNIGETKENTEGVFDVSEGVECEKINLYNGEECHFLCDECLTKLVDTSINDDALSIFERNKCQILCVVDDCGRSYSEKSIALHTSDDLFRKYTATKIKVKEAELAKKMAREMEIRLEEKMEKWKKMTAHEKKIHKLRTHIIEEIFTLKCPRCSKAFLDFNGCCALKCTDWVRGDPNSCCQFCAYCLKDCGADAHPHVRAGDCCPENKGLFLKDGEIKDVHKARRTRMLKKYLRGINDTIVQVEIISSIQREMRDLDLNPQDFTPVGY
jgi:ankyrin repeat protein